MKTSAVRLAATLPAAVLGPRQTKSFLSFPKQVKLVGGVGSSFEPAAEGAEGDSVTIEPVTATLSTAAKLVTRNIE